MLDAVLGGRNPPHLVICRVPRNFAYATAPGIYLGRDRYCGLYSDASASAGGAELERRAGG